MSKVPSFSLAIIINENTLFDKVGFGKKTYLYWGGTTPTLHQPNLIKEESSFKNGGTLTED